MNRASLVFCASLGALPLAAAVCNVRDFGAAADGSRKDTAAIQKALDTCAKRGGGTVLLPSGKYLSGSLQLRSAVALELESGATLLASIDPADYPIRSNPWSSERKEISAFLYGEDLHDVTIRGAGVIDGQGQVWWRRHWLANPRRNMPKPSTPAELAEATAVANGRPHLIRIVGSKHVAIEGLRLVNSPHWTIHPVFCEFVRVHGVTILNPVPSPNTDGINPESCRNVHISNCLIDAGDDCITLKSGRDEVGRKMGRPNENITITNCTTLRGHGGVVIGSEMSGGVRNVTVSNCVFQGTDKGIRIKSQRGRGGVVEGITISNIVMHDVPEAINITTFYAGSDKPEDTVPVGEGTPRFRDILISNVYAYGSKTAGQITGLKEMPVERVVLNNVRVKAAKPLVCRDTRDLSWFNVRIESPEGVQTDCAPPRR